MLMPKRVKRRKQFRGSMAGKALRGNTISNGEYGLVALEPCWIKSNQIEAARVATVSYTHLRTSVRGTLQFLQRNQHLPKSPLCKYQRELQTES